MSIIYRINNTNKTVGDLFVGDKEVKKVYVGDQLVYKKKEEYFVRIVSPESTGMYMYRDGTPWDGTIYYSINKGQTWVNWNTTLYSVSISSHTELWLRGVGNTYITHYSSSTTAPDKPAIGFGYNGDRTPSTVYIGGNLECLLDYQTVENGGHPTMATHCFDSLFKNQAYIENYAVIKAGRGIELGATSQYCLDETFKGCTSLTVMPKLTATTLSNYCYQYAFDGCTALSKVNKLPATTMVNSCYQYMFRGCTSLTKVPEMTISNLVASCCGYMFQNCTSLTNITPMKITATSTTGNGALRYLFSGCTSLQIVSTTFLSSVINLSSGNQQYSGMFSSCTALIQAPNLPATSINNSYQSMFYGCTSLTTPPSIKATTLSNDSCYGMFQNCTSLTSLPRLRPLTLTAYNMFFTKMGCYQNMFSGCTNIKLYTTYSASHPYQFRIPYSGTGTMSDSVSVQDMFTNTGGTFTGSPSINTYYYTDNPTIA